MTIIECKKAQYHFDVNIGDMVHVAAVGDRKEHPGIIDAILVDRFGTRVRVSHPTTNGEVSEWVSPDTVTPY